MGSFRCYDSSNVIATLMMTNFHLNTTDVAIFPNVCLWRRSLCSDLVLTLKNRIEPPPYARTAYVVAIWPSFHFDSFIKIWATCEMFLGKWFTAPPGKKFPVRLCVIRVLLPIRLFRDSSAKVAKKEKFSFAKIPNKYCWKYAMNYSSRGRFRTLIFS